jgi:phosphoribosylformylglycinamidine synthase II
MIYRIDVGPKGPANPAAAAAPGPAAADPVGQAVRQQVRELGTDIGPVATTRVFLLDTDAPAADVRRVAAELLADAVVESAVVTDGSSRSADLGGFADPAGTSRIEVHLKPGVMDPVAASAEMAIRDMGLSVRAVRTGRAYLIHSQVPRAELERIASRVLANGVVESVHFERYLPQAFAAGQPYVLKLRHVELRNLTDEQLQKLSREGHLFLSLAEMKAVQAYFKERGREPTDVELETVAQTWSEHCVHKTLKSAVDIEVRDATGRKVGTRHYDNLIKETIFDSTMTLMGKGPAVAAPPPGGMGVSPMHRPGSKDASSAQATPTSQGAHRRDTHATKADFCLSVFKDNAGVIAFDDVDAVCFKVETHNHPSAIEPYGGSATGAGGVIRDILGTGLAARPIANTDVFCVAHPHRPAPIDAISAMASLAVPFNPPPGADPKIVDLVSLGDPAGNRYLIARYPAGLIARFPAGYERVECFEPGMDRPAGYLIDPLPGAEAAVERDMAAGIALMKQAGVPVVDIKTTGALPKGVIHPKRVLQQVVAGVRDYGNRMGIPTVNGAVYFDDRYLGNPLVFCGCVGILPRDKIEKAARPGDAVVVMGGRTGRDGIHGATFSSAELTDTHADEFSHAVQIGNAITEKKVADVILAARDLGLFTAVTDCGAGGLSSAVGEMGEKLGATVQLDAVPLKYDGLRYDEIWISEAQERMVLSVPQDKLAELLALAKAEDVEATAIGTFGTPGEELILTYGGTEVGRLSMHLLHNGIPMPRRKAVVVDAPPANDLLAGPLVSLTSNSAKARLLALLGHPNVASKHWVVRQYDHEVQGGSVVKPFVGPDQRGPSDAAVVRPKLDSLKGVAVGCGMVPHVKDPYAMAVASIDEAVRNVVAVGASLDKMAILDNFCWPSVDDEVTMGHLVRTCEACRDAALAYGVPFISGKDSLHNQFTNSETGQVLRIPNTLLVSAIAVIDDVRTCVTMDLKQPDSTLFLLTPPNGTGPTDLAALPLVHRALSEAIGAGMVASCHDVSDGGVLTAAAEMCIGSGLGLAVPVRDEADPALFAELPGRYLVEVTKDRYQQATEFFAGKAVSFEGFARVLAEPKLVISELTRVAHDIPLDQLVTAWRGTLDW